MTPDERIRAALTDLQSLLEEGVEPQAALTEAAETHGFRKEVLAKRAEHLGPLEEVKPRFEIRAALHQKHLEARNAVREFCADPPSGMSLENWMIDKAGRPPTDDETCRAFHLISERLVLAAINSEKFKRA